MGDLVTARLVFHPMNAIEAERVVAAEPDDGARWAPGYPAEGDVAGASTGPRPAAGQPGSAAPNCWRLTGISTGTSRVTKRGSG
jgi:hypothetical protein